MKRVGIIGGMGPLATIDLYSKIVSLTAAKSDQEHIALVIDSYPQIPDRTEFLLHNGKSPLPFLKESALRLKNAGCEAICMACNTAHYFAKDLEEQCEIKIIHIADAAINGIWRDFAGASEIAVIGTTGTKHAKIYEDRLLAAGFSCVFISDLQMKAIMDCIYKGAKAGNINSFIELFNQTIASIKADAYIAACTEIPLFLPYAKETRWVDATMELARSVVAFSLFK